MLSTLAKSAVRPAAFSRAVRSLATAAAAVKPEKKKDIKPKESDSFCMNLFRGRAVIDQVFPYPLELDEDRRETLHLITGPLEKFLEEVNDVVNRTMENDSESRLVRIDRRDDDQYVSHAARRRPLSSDCKTTFINGRNDEKMEIPKEVLKQFAELGAFGAVVPPEYEGAGMNNTQLAKMAEIVGAHDLSLGVVMGAHQSIGYKGILLFGTDQQKAKYLPDLASGRKFAAFCLTEPASGSDANVGGYFNSKSISTRAVKSPDGKHYILNGGKIWISNGGFADIFTVFAQTPVTTADGTTKDRVSAFIVERSFGGVTSGPPEKKMGIKGSNTTEVHFDNVKVPVENLLGPEGEGFKVAMNILNNGRFTIPAACTGAMKICIQKTVDHITQRVQFGQTLQEFFNVQEKLTNMISRHYATESIVYLLASNMDRGIQDYQLEAAIGKVAASENAWYVCDEAIQLHGGMGFMTDTGLERIMRDLRIFRIFEGANDVMRLFVALTGAQHAGKHLQQVAKDIKSGGIGTLFGQVIKRATGGSTGANFEAVVDSSLTESAKKLNACILEFGKTIEDLLIKHKKGIIDRQYELIRVADAAIDIYSMIATLSRCTNSCKKNAPSASHEKEITTYFCNIASRRAMNNLKEAAGSRAKDIALISSIASTVCKNGGMPQQHPIDL